MKYSRSKTFFIFMLMILVVLTSCANSAANDQNLKEFASERFKTNLADRQTRHYQTNIVFLEITNDFARTQTMILLVHKVKGEKQPKIMGSGIYKDELIKTKNGWKISRRTLITD